MDARPSPTESGFLTFLSALIGGLVPLVPFAFLPLRPAVVISVAISLAGLFALGSWTGRLSGAVWWRDGLRLIAVAGVAAGAAAVIATLISVD